MANHFKWQPLSERVSCVLKSHSSSVPSERNQPSFSIFSPAIACTWTCWRTGREVPFSPLHLNVICTLSPDTDLKVGRHRRNLVGRGCPSLQGADPYYWLGQGV